MGKKGFILDYSRRLHIAANSHSFAYIHSMACSTLSSVSYYPILIQRTRFKWGEKQQLTPDIRLYVWVVCWGSAGCGSHWQIDFPFFFPFFLSFFLCFFPSPLGIATRRRPTRQNYATVYAYNNSPVVFFSFVMCVASFPKIPPSLSYSLSPFCVAIVYLCLRWNVSATLWFVNAPTNVFNYYWPDENDREANWWISWPLIWQLVLTWWWWIDNDEKQVWRIFSFFNFSTSKGGINEWTNDRYDVTCINAHAMNPACRQKINFFFTTKRHWAAAIAAVRIVVL